MQLVTKAPHFFFARLLPCKWHPMGMNFIHAALRTSNPPVALKAHRFLEYLTSKDRTSQSASAITQSTHFLTPMSINRRNSSASEPREIHDFVTHKFPWKQKEFWWDHFIALHFFFFSVRLPQNYRKHTTWKMKPLFWLLEIKFQKWVRSASTCTGSFLFS